MTGAKTIVKKPVINPTEDKMEYEKEPPVYGRGWGKCKGLCTICGQIIGHALCHPGTSGDAMAVRQDRAFRACSVVRLAVGRRKQNVSVLVGRLEEEAQKQIVSVALNRIAERKGHKFRLRGIDGGGVAGISNEVEMGIK